MIVFESVRVAVSWLPSYAGCVSFLLSEFVASCPDLQAYRVGLENPLTSAQTKTLLLENQDRKGIRVVGFDWIAKRAEAVTRNVIERDISTKTVRMV
jgi:hypothetical protein